MDMEAHGALSGGINWVASLLTGSIGVSLCALAVAAIGALMLTGHMPTRRGW